MGITFASNTQAFQPDVISLEEKRVLNLINTDEVIELLQKLIRQRSDTPPGDCRAAVEVVSHKLAEAKIIPARFARREHQPNLLAIYGDPNSRPRLMYHSHIDTVPAGELERWNVDPFWGVRLNNLVFGRGAGDDKGSVAAQVMAMVTLARAGVKLNGNLQLAVVADEESGSLYGTHWLRKEGTLKPDLLVVGEQTQNCVAIAERVACGIDLTVFGKAAHGAMPWAGENAVLKAGRVLTWLQDTLFPVLKARTHPYLPPATLNIGKIHGGIQWSIVPERCVIEMDRRLLPGETREMAVEEIRQSLEAFSSQVEPLKFELFSTGEVAANINTPDNDPFVSVANRALEDICGEKRPLTGYVQTSDGRWFARDGIPIIIFGPSDPAVAHGPDEHVSVEQMIEAVRFLTILALRSLGAGAR
jgi:succinyl-diaminopimelate desuccinylase